MEQELWEIKVLNGKTIQNSLFLSWEECQLNVNDYVDNTIELMEDSF